MMPVVSSLYFIEVDPEIFSMAFPYRFNKGRCQLLSERMCIEYWLTALIMPAHERSGYALVICNHDPPAPGNSGDFCPADPC